MNLQTPQILESTSAAYTPPILQAITITDNADAIIGVFYIKNSILEFTGYDELVLEHFTNYLLETLRTKNSVEFFLEDCKIIFSKSKIIMDNVKIFLKSSKCLQVVSTCDISEKVMSLLLQILNEYDLKT